MKLSVLLFCLLFIQVTVQEEIFKCFGLDSSDPNVCRGNGVCSSSNTCICKAGYSDIQCKSYSCFGYSYTNSNACSRNGICLKPNTCQCKKGWIGSDCSINNATEVIYNKSLVSELNSKKFNVNKKSSVQLPNNLSKYLEKKNINWNDSIIMKSSFQEDSNFVSGILTLTFETVNQSLISIVGLETPIQIVFDNVSFHESRSLNYSCVYYNDEKQIWESNGLQTFISLQSILSITCKTTHLTRFTVIDLNLNSEMKNNPTAMNSNSDLASTSSSGIIIAAVVTSSVSLCIIFSVSISIVVFFIVIMNRKSRRHCCGINRK